MFGNRLKQLREEKGLRQEDIGAILGVGKSTISQYESGKRQPDLFTLQKIANYFNVSFDYLLGRSNIRRPDNNKIDIVGVIENTNYQLTAGDAPLSQEQRVGILRAVDNPSAYRKPKVPILGAIRAGIPLLSEQNIIGEVDIPEDLEGRVDFALYVRGDSMIGAGIIENDIVICKQNQTPNNGDIVVALINHDETTLKFYIQENGRVFLRAANPNYKDIEIKPNDGIQGHVVKIFKDSPSVNVYRDYIYIQEGHLQEWNEVIEKAIGYGIKPERVKSILEMHYEMLNKK